MEKKSPGLPQQGATPLFSKKEVCKLMKKQPDFSLEL